MGVLWCVTGGVVGLFIDGVVDVDVHIGGVVGFTVIGVWVCRYEGVQCGCSECGRL